MFNSTECNPRGIVQCLNRELTLKGVCRGEETEQGCNSTYCVIHKLKENWTKKESASQKFFQKEYFSVTYFTSKKSADINP